MLALVCAVGDWNKQYYDTNQDHKIKKSPRSIVSWTIMIGRIGIIRRMTTAASTTFTSASLRLNDDKTENIKNHQGF